MESICIKSRINQIKCLENINQWKMKSDLLLSIFTKGEKYFLEFIVSWRYLATKSNCIHILYILDLKWDRSINGHLLDSNLGLKCWERERERERIIKYKMEMRGLCLMASKITTYLPSFHFIIMYLDMSTLDVRHFYISMCIKSASSINSFELAIIR